MSKQKFKGFEGNWFVLTPDFHRLIQEGGSYQITDGYYDHKGIFGKPGKFVRFVTSRDEKGKETAKRFRFNESFWRVMTRDSDVDVDGNIKQYDFLKNHPECEGSPYGNYEVVDGVRVQVGVVFKELNEDRDAEIALKADELRTRAQADVLSLDEDTIAEVAAILGVYGQAPKIMRLKVLEYAGKKPAEYNELMASGDRAVRALVRKAIAEEMFTRKGSVIYWDSTVVGSDEDDAIATLLSDQNMIDVLQEKLGSTTEIKAPKRRGNPAWRKKAKTVSA